MAGDRDASEVDRLRQVACAARVRERAAGMKGASGRRRDRTRYFALERLAAAAAHFDVGDRVEEQACVRVQRTPEDDVCLAPLHEPRSEEHTSELQSQSNLVCRLLLE